MNTQTGESNQTDAPGAPGVSDAAAEASEQQLRAAYEAELSRITSSDMMLQAAASLLNIGAHRLGLTGPVADGSDMGGAAPQRDLEQVRDAIDAVRALLLVIERSRPQELRPLRDALSQLQMAYTREVQVPSEPTASEEPPTASAPKQTQGASGPGPAESSGRLWVPGR